MKIRKAVPSDLGQIELLYNDLCDYLEMNQNYPGWKKGVYPVRENAENGLREDSLFVAQEEDKIIGTFILRHKPEDGYKMPYGLRKTTTPASMSYTHWRFIQITCIMALGWRS